MKVKVLFEVTAEELEEPINKFIQTKKVIDIKFNSENGNYALIMYEDPATIKQETFYFSDDTEVNDFIKKHDVVNVEHFGNGDEINTVVTYLEKEE